MKGRRHRRRRATPNRKSTIASRSLRRSHVYRRRRTHGDRRARSIRCTAMQIFVKNNMQWFARPLSQDEIRAFLDHQQRAQFSSVFAHANYLINLAATNPQFHANSLRALAEELTRADQLEFPFLVLHPGAHLGAGEEAGLERSSLRSTSCFREYPTGKTQIARETTAGQGFCHRSPSNNSRISSQRMREPDRLCVCLDTAHMFSPPGTTSAGTRGVRKVFRELDRVIGRSEGLVAIHVNDWKTDRGSRVDRHEHIGKGRIGLEALASLCANSCTIAQNPKSSWKRQKAKTCGGRDKPKDAAPIGLSTS